VEHRAVCTIGRLTNADERRSGCDETLKFRRTRSDNPRNGSGNRAVSG
jgi:hypothetical protein